MGKINQNRTNANKNSRFNPYIFTVILGIIGAAIITAVLISLLWWEVTLVFFAIKSSHDYWLHNMISIERLELSRLSAHEPESCASANSAIWTNISNRSDKTWTCTLFSNWFWVNLVFRIPTHCENTPGETWTLTKIIKLLWILSPMRLPVPPLVQT